MIKKEHGIVSPSTMVYISTLPLKLAKSRSQEGGPGSGQKGHKTDRPPSKKGASWAGGADAGDHVHVTIKPSDSEKPQKVIGVVDRVVKRNPHGEEPDENKWEYHIHVPADQVPNDPGGRYSGTFGAVKGSPHVTIHGPKKSEADSATTQVSQLRDKTKEAGSKGEGSRGGVVIAHTKSGKPVYQSGNRSKGLDEETAYGRANSAVRKGNPEDSKQADHHQGIMDYHKDRMNGSKESSKPAFKFNLKEANNSPFKNHTFQAILIEEGMGNFKDCFFYTKQALQGSVSSKLFEGLQCYADHPTEIEEKIQPERSTRDILGYYQNVQYQEADDGTGRLVADLCIGSSISLDWAMSLLTNSIDYSTKFKESDLVGLSINASGSANPMGIDDFIQSQPLSATILSKLNEAKGMGITDINVVNELTEAQSVDLVTRAGAGGKILKMLEMEKSMAKKKLNESEEKQEKGAAPGAPMAAPAVQDDHADADQDQALFGKMIKQYLGKDDAQPEEMEMAKNAYEAHKEAGMEHQEAYEAAGNHLKMAMAIGKKMAGKDQDQAESGEKESESEHESESQEAQTSPDKLSAGKQEKKKESMAIIQLSGEVAKLRESVNQYKMKDYLDKKLKESGKSNSFTKAFREALGAPRSEKHVDETWKLFLKAADAGVEEVGSDSDSFITEKQSYRESDSSSGKLDLSSCLRF